MLRVALLALMLGVALPSTGLAGNARAAADWRGHPIRVAAYFLHPFGVLLEQLIFRPAAAIASHEPIRTLVGMEPPPEATPGRTPNPFLEPYTEEP